MASVCGEFLELLVKYSLMIGYIQVLLQLSLHTGDHDEIYCGLSIAIMAPVMTAPAAAPWRIAVV
jgi:hypothetical protein